MGSVVGIGFNGLGRNKIGEFFPLRSYQTIIMRFGLILLSALVVLALVAEAKASPLDSSLMREKTGGLGTLNELPLLFYNLLVHATYSS